MLKTDQTVPDGDLINRSKAGDLDAFNLLVERYQNDVYSLALRMTSSTQTAEDVAQDTFISAFRNIERFREGNFRAWLLRIASNASLDELRRRKRRGGFSLDEMMDAPESTFEVPEEGPGPEDEAEARELESLIQRGLQTLPEDQRLAIVLRDIQGLSYEEVAETMKSSVGTVKSRISRGRSRLRDYLRMHPELIPESMR
jgi:RNA polymerase sigma-70 factor (ECF subfamily)